MNVATVSFISSLSQQRAFSLSLRLFFPCRAFYSGSVVLNISKHTLSGGDGGEVENLLPQISMENVANRRRFEVPGKC